MLSWLRPVRRLSIDYTKPPELPADAIRIIRHDAAREGVFTLPFDEIGFGPLDFRESYASFRDRRVRNYDLDERLADACVLDALTEACDKNTKMSKRLMKKYFGRPGLFFFLGTEFETKIGPCVPYLDTGLVSPKGRYLMPSKATASAIVPCYAVYVGKGIDENQLLG